MKWLGLLAFFIFFEAHSDINVERHDFQFEYGFTYHTLVGTQKNNNSKGRLTSPQYPFWSAAYAYRFSQNYAIRFSGGISFVRFDEPEESEATLKSENKVLNHYEVELIRKTGAYSKFGIFFRQQDHPLYFAKTPTEFEVVENSFYESGIHLSLSQRRRIGLIWGLGVKGYLLFPTEGGDIVTEAGYGGDAYARLGWIGPLGTTYQLKGFYLYSSAPNAEVTFSHEQLGYSFLINLTF